jgi:hypothetical protein
MQFIVNSEPQQGGILCIHKGESLILWAEKFTQRSDWGLNPELSESESSVLCQGYQIPSSTMSIVPICAESLSTLVSVLET